MRYKIMKMRAKISFTALQKQMTIAELLTRQILKSYGEIHENGPKWSGQEEEVFDAIINGERGLIKNLVIVRNFKRVEQEKLREVLQGKEEKEVVHQVKNGIIQR